MNKGITLIEVLLYIALFAIIIGGTMTAVYQIIESTNDTNTKVIALEEGNFLQRKIEVELTGASSVNITGANNEDMGISPTGVRFLVSGGELNIERASGGIKPLSNSFVKIEPDAAPNDKVFIYDPATKRIDVRFLVNGQVFSQTKYIY